MVGEEQFELAVLEDQAQRRSYSTITSKMSRVGKARMDVMQLVFIYNLLLMPFGIVLLIAGAVTENGVHPYKEFLYGRFHTIAISTIMAGLTDVMAAVFGCYGVLRDRACMLWIYPHLLVLIFFFQVAIAGMSFINQSGEVLLIKLNESMQSYATYNRTLDRLQTGLQCCGFDSYSEFTNLTMPSSCCSSHACSTEDRYTQGCKRALENRIRVLGNAMGVASLILAAVEIFGLITLCFYTQHMTGRRYRRTSLSAQELLEENYSDDEKSSVMDL